MAIIDVYFDDRKRQRRRRILGGILIVLATLLGSRFTGAAQWDDPPIRPRIIRVPETRYQTFEPYLPGPPPKSVVEPAAVDFEPLKIGGGSPPRLVSVRNAGSHQLDVALSVTGDGFRMTHSCPDRLNENERCDAAIVFSPAREGRHRGELRVVARDGRQSVRLSGVATAADVAVTPTPEITLYGKLPLRPSGRQAILPVLVERTKRANNSPQRIPDVEPRHIHFVRAGRKSVIVSNPFDTPLQIDRIALEGESTAGYDLENSERCEGALNPGHSCTFDVIAKPVEFYARTVRLKIQSQ